MQTSNETEIATVPLAALESASERSQRTIRILAIAWGVSALALGVSLAHVLLA